MRKILVTGATGYIGGRLVPCLLEQEYHVRILVRDPVRISGRDWAGSVDIAVGDLTDSASLKSAFNNIDTAYYLVHSMYDGIDYVKQDRLAARNFVKVGKDLKQVIYLGGIQPQSKNISRHLKSRAEVGEIIRSALPTTEFRAGPIIGSGSASFELIRYLTQRLPLMIAPDWILNEAQPIAIRDILSYLVSALNHESLGIMNVGAERVTFKQMLDVYADVRNLMKRIIITVPPFLPTRQIAKWFGLVVTIPNALIVPLMEGISHNIIADNTKAKDVFPEITPISYRKAVELAIEQIEKETVATCWSGAQGYLPAYELTDREGLIRETRTRYTNHKPEDIFRSFTSIGGKHGWFVWNWAWEIRGIIDIMSGGPGLRRGRRHSTELLPGEALDFWRVEEIDAPHLLRLRAEMKIPGRAWLQWEAIPDGNGTRLIQTAMFSPKGLWGTLYWYSFYFIHKLIFSGMINSIIDNATISRETKSAS